ncbi:MAG: aldo/keto reductase [Actinomycetota bacterium]|nr:aldo/keto reductase [Actinomycetota bacterium]MDD5666778.1 aldo/keto reductase [Actinomycetota bacterium]
MLYRKFGRDGWDASILGFGCMRLPTSDGIPISANIVEDEAIRMIRRAIDEGINYLDTAYTYHEGRSEVLLGKALRDGYRERVHIATKSPVWLVENADDFDRFLDEQLERLQVGPIDYYLFHGLNKKRWENIQAQGLLARAEAAVADGRIGRVGFSFHDAYGIFEEIIDGYDGWSMCQIQYNYMDTENQAGTRGLQYAASRGIAVVVMEPLLGGNLARPPADVRELFHAHGEGRTPAEWALQWIWDQPEVAVVLSGMSDMGQLEENILTARNAAERRLGREDMELIAHVRETFERKAAIPCTGCGYCLPCPQGVDIPAMFELYNNGLIYDDLPVSRFRYFRFYTEADRAGACTACGECEGKCPQDIPVSERMPGVHAVLGEGRPYPQGHAK